MSFLSILLVAISGISLVAIGRRLKKSQLSFAGFQLRYQVVTLLLSLVLFALTGLSGTWFFAVGNVNAPVSDFGWLGATASDRWSSFGITFLVLMSVVTAVVVWLQSGKNQDIKLQTLLKALPLAAVFSVFNALTEELIFRVSLVQGIGQSMQPWLIALISAVLFGALHFFGMPGKIPGVLMAGFMGWLLTFAVIQTGGIFWAWIIHFAQDVIILTIAYAAEKSKTSGNDKTL